MSVVNTDSAQIPGKTEAFNQARYAICYAPEKNSPLNSFGQTWLGRDVRTGNRIDQPEVEGVYSQELRNIVSPAAFYGFHGTLKPPFYLPVPELEEKLISDIQAFAASEKSFHLPRLTVARIGRILVLEPERSSDPINRLAERCVRHFDSYRRSSSCEDSDDRASSRLSSTQQENIIKWGNPYVMDEFKFHLSLTGPILDIHLSDHLMRVIQRQIAALDLNSIEVASICLFFQADKNQPFLLHSRYKFGRS